MALGLPLFFPDIIRAFWRLFGHKSVMNVSCFFGHFPGKITRFWARAAGFQGFALVLLLATGSFSARAEIQSAELRNKFAAPCQQKQLNSMDS